MTSQRKDDCESNLILNSFVQIDQNGPNVEASFLSLQKQALLRKSMQELCLEEKFEDEMFHFSLNNPVPKTPKALTLTNSNPSGILNIGYLRKLPYQRKMLFRQKGPEP